MAAARQLTSHVRSATESAFSCASGMPVTSNMLAAHASLARMPRGPWMQLAGAAVHVRAALATALQSKLWRREACAVTTVRMCGLVAESKTAVQA